MRPAAVKILAALAICGLTAFAATASGGTSAGPFGVGLKLGKVVNKIPVGSSIGPWLVWAMSDSDIGPNSVVGLLQCAPASGEEMNPTSSWHELPQSETG